jgi:diguanylate cyclase (GGDEF)-like protein
VAGYPRRVLRFAARSSDTPPGLWEACIWGKARVASVLVIEDSDAAREYIKSVLEQAGLFASIVEARDGLAGLRAILQQSFDMVLCDLEMPGLDGEKLLRAHRDRRGAEDVPFFFLTAERDPDRLARLLRAGAADTITKPFHPAELLARVETHLRLRRLRAELREKNTILEKLSTTDALTGLRNRRYVGEVLTLEVLRATRYGTALSVLMADLDRFKHVNDTYGHPVGDAVLRSTGEAIAHLLRKTDVGGRYGGEEFIAILHHTDLEGAAVLAERLRHSVAAMECVGHDGSRFSITISIGIAQLGPNEDTASLVRAADAALYAAKAGGRNRVESAPPRTDGLDMDKGKSRPGSRPGRSR